MVNVLGTGIDARDISFYSDASASPTLGFGAILGEKWIQGNWDTCFMLKHEPSIEFLEMFALCTGVLTWQKEDILQNNTILLWCDNMVVVHMVNNLTSSCTNCMQLLRILVLNRLKFNRKLIVKYVSTKDNFLADSLSRRQMTRFRKPGPHMNQMACEISSNIWPMSKVWQ